MNLRELTPSDTDNKSTKPRKIKPKKLAFYFVIAHV